MANLSQPVAFRIYTKRIENQKRVNTVKTDINRVDSSSLNSDDDISGNKAKIWDKDWPELVLVFDCETTIDETQRLTFGAFRVYSFSKLVLEGLFYDDDLAKDDLDILNQWAESRKEGDIDKEVLKPLGKILLLSRTVFIKKIFMMVGYHRGGVIVGFNLPFDISRIAIGYDEPKKGLFKDGFVFSFKNYVDSNGKLQQDQFTPRVGVKSIDTKRAIIGFMNPKRDRQKKNHGQFVDLRSFSYTLTGKPHTLNSACEAFGLNMQKMVVEVHGKITLEYIDYCRKDVSLTWSLYKRLIEEYRHHPVSVLPSRLYSPASLGKGYLQAMNIRLPEIKIDAELGLDKDQIYGFAMQSYYGGRVECRNPKGCCPGSVL